MFYETERIINKQNKYIKRKALDVVNSFMSKTLTQDEIVACIDVMLGEDNTETRVDVLNLARKIVISNKENVDESNAISNEPCISNGLFQQ
jgi:ribosomal protein S24E